MTVQPLYTTEILRLAASLPELRALEREDGRAELRSPTCGSRVMVAVQMENERLACMALAVHACAFGQASSAIMAASAAGADRELIKSTIFDLQDWLAGSRDDPGRWPNLLALAPARKRASRHGAILLPFRALFAAIEQAES